MIPLSERDLAEAMRLNRTLNKAPRFRVRNPLAPVLIQSLLRLSQLGSDRRVWKAGLSVEQRTIGTSSDGVRVRILRPAGQVRGVVLDIHGGGWVIGNARMNDAPNIALVQACDVAFVSVEYRLAGRSRPLQALMDDCLAAARWLLEGGLPDYRALSVFLVGESAGGHLAAATLLRPNNGRTCFRKSPGRCSITASMTWRGRTVSGAPARTRSYSTDRACWRACSASPRG